MTSKEEKVKCVLWLRDELNPQWLLEGNSLLIMGRRLPIEMQIIPFFSKIGHSVIMHVQQ